MSLFLFVYCYYAYICFILGFSFHIHIHINRIYSVFIGTYLVLVAFCLVLFVGASLSVAVAHFETSLTWVRGAAEMID